MISEKEISPGLLTQDVPYIQIVRDGKRVVLHRHNLVFVYERGYDRQWVMDFVTSFADTEDILFGFMENTEAITAVVFSATPEKTITSMLMNMEALLNCKEVRPN